MAKFRSMTRLKKGWTIFISQSTPPERAKTRINKGFIPMATGMRTHLRLFDISRMKLGKSQNKLMASEPASRELKKATGFPKTAIRRMFRR